MKARFFGLLATATLVSFPVFAAERGCLMYEPGVVNLKGKLHHTTIWLLELDTPKCVEGKEKDKSGMYPTKDAVKTAVLMTRKDDSMDNYGALIDKEVVLTGTIFSKFDNSEDQVTMMVAKVKPQTPEQSDSY